MSRRDGRSRQVFTRRALIIGGVQLAAFGGLAARLYQVQVVEGARYATLARTNRINTRLIAPPRGRLFDRSGVLLAGNRLNWRALLIAEQAGDVARTLDNFSRLVPLPARERARILHDIKRHRRFIPVTLRKYLSWNDMARIEANAPDLPGVLVDAGTTRIYPFGPVLAHVVGYVAPPNDQEVAADPLLALPGTRVGRAGMEKADEDRLRGRAGAVQLEVNAIGRVIRELARQDGTPGQDVRLTIDSGLQGQVLGHLGRESASAVVMNCQNGEVLAMATNPSFDPSLFNSGVSQAQWKAWIDNPRTPLINKAVAGLYSPGSTFKMVVALSALQAKTVSPTEKIFCPGYLDFGGRRFHCWKRGGHGWLDMRGALKHSCDVFFYETARRTGMDAIAAMANRFGLGVKLDLELPGTKTGLVPTKEWRERHGHHWNIGDTIVAGIGQGFTRLPPVALATMVARIASGRAVQPHLTRGFGKGVAPGANPGDWPRLGIPERMMQVVRDGMWEVVNAPHGTAPEARLKLPGVQMAGKTGSVQVRNVSREQRERGYKSEDLPWKYRPHALFVCYAPFAAPRYALGLVVEHGNSGADTAAPIAQAIMTDVLTRDPAARQAEGPVGTGQPT